MLSRAIILAAGKGTRMRSPKPKVLQPLANQPLLGHVIKTALSVSQLKPIVVFGYGGEQVKQAMSAHQVAWAEQAEQKGTGHAVLQALPQVGVDEVCLILYGDVPLIGQGTLQQMLDLMQSSDLVLLTDYLHDPTGYGRIIRNDTEQVVAIREQKDANPDELKISEINTGILAAKSADLHRWLAQLQPNNAQGELYLTDIIGMAAEEGKIIRAIQPTHSIEVIGVNDKLQLAQLERDYQRVQADALMVQGLTLIDPNRFDCRGHLSIGTDCLVDINCVIEGKVILGNHVTIGPNVCIKNATLGDGVTVFANSVIEGARIDAKVQIGPFARIRPDTHLMQGSKIGNFVEIKKSVIGEGSKVSHLSYIGDTQMGKEVNVGAGTITCNYDGVNKHETHIGDGAFIGSDSQLVAPVTVGAGATIGAGSTVTKDAPPHQLTLSRAKQVSLSNWKRPEKKA